MIQRVAATGRLPVRLKGVGKMKRRRLRGLTGLLLLVAIVPLFAGPSAPAVKLVVPLPGSCSVARTSTAPFPNNQSLSFVQECIFKYRGGPIEVSGASTATRLRCVRGSYDCFHYPETSHIVAPAPSSVSIRAIWNGVWVASCKRVGDGYGYNSCSQRRTPSIPLGSIVRCQLVGEAPEANLLEAHALCRADFIRYRHLIDSRT